MIQRSMAPVWEANHVWLIFVLVIVWTAFPVAFGSIFSTLYIPLFIAAIGIIFRGTAFVLRGQAATINEARVLGALFALSSVLIPFFFGAALGGIASGRVQVGNAVGDPIDSWLNPTSALIGVDRGPDRRATWPRSTWPATPCAPSSPTSRARSARARCWPAPPAASAALGGLLVVRSDAPRALRRPHLRRRAGDGDRVRRSPARPRSRSCGRSATAPRASRAALAVAAIVVGWALAQDPYLLPPGAHARRGRRAPTRRSRRRSSSSRSGCSILGPSLWFLYRLVLQGRLDQTYEPLDQRFHP